MAKYCLFWLFIGHNTRPTNCNRLQFYKALTFVLGVLFKANSKYEVKRWQ